MNASLKTAIVLCAGAIVALPSQLHAFIIEGGEAQRWTSTASGPTGDRGDPVTLTWSIVPDGTPIQPSQRPIASSTLIATLDEVFGGGLPGDSLEDRPWFQFFEESFARYGELGGLNYVYESHDDGSQIGDAAGVLGVRGDIRIGGVAYDGPQGTVAYNTFPDYGDMVIDVDDQSLIGNSAADYVRLRNLIMHEHGHGLGMLHVDAPSDGLLMEGFVQTSFTGPQLDEVRAIHFSYGDVNEKSNGGQGNDDPMFATSLGVILPGGAVAVGTDAGTSGQQVAIDATDFVSIDNASDVDLYSFDVTGPATLNAVLTPRGGVLVQGSDTLPLASFDANARVDLVLDILDGDGFEQFALADYALAGGVETLSGVELPEAGTYIARVYGLDDTIQLYELRLSISPTVLLEADFDEDGEVDANDLEAWKSSFAVNAEADADDDLDADGADFLTWQRQFGQTPPIESSAASTNAPEPSTYLLALFAVASAGWRVASRRQTGFSNTHR